MKKGGLVFLSIILALVIILLGASAGALAYTNGVPAIKQRADANEGTDNTLNSEEISEGVDTFTLNKSFDQFTLNNNLASSEDKDKKNEAEKESKEGEEDTSENKEDTEETKEDSKNSEDTEAKEDSENKEAGESAEDGENKEDSDKKENSDNKEDAVTGKEGKKEVKEEEKKSSPKYLFADSSKKKLDEKSALALVKKLESMNYVIPADTSIPRMIINEMYAKHGAKFKNENIQRYFNKKSWYKKIKKKISTDKAFSKMKKIEKKNIEVLDVVDKYN